MTFEESIAACIAERYGVRLEPVALVEVLKELRNVEPGNEERLLTELLLEPDKLRAIAGRFTIGESYFFRHPEQLTAISVWLRQTLQRSPARITVWSAGCSRGEELYSVGMRLYADCGNVLPERIILCGTDLDRDAIDCARRGLYGVWSLRGTTLDEQNQFFLAQEGGFLLHDEFRRRARFEHLSIQERLEQWADASVSVILFRNVGIYFTPDALTHVHREFARVLREDGILVQSATDPRPDDLYLVGDTSMPVGIYRRRLLSSVRGGGKGQPSDCGALSRVSRHPPAATQGEPSWLGSKVAETRPLTVSAPQTVQNKAQFKGQSPEKVEDTSGELEAIESLADRGELASAERRIAAYIALHPTSAAALLKRAQLVLHRGDDAAAVRDLRAALFVCPEFHLARYWYVLALEHGGRLQEAREHLALLEQSLANPTEGEEKGLAELKVAVEEHLRSLK